MDYWILLYLESTNGGVLCIALCISGRNESYKIAIFYWCRLEFISIEAQFMLDSCSIHNTLGMHMNALPLQSMTYSMQATIDENQWFLNDRLKVSHSNGKYIWR